MRHRKLRYLISSVLISLVMVCSTSPIVASATPTSGATIASQQQTAWSEQSVQARMAQISNQDLELSGMEGAVNSLRVITDMGIYLSFMNQSGTYGITFPESEFNQYYAKFMNNINAFNKAFGSGNGGVPKMTLTTKGLGSPSNLDMTDLFNQIANYIQSLCYKVNGSQSALSGRQLTKVVQDNKQFLLAVIQFNNSIGTCVNSINNIIPATYNTRFTIPDKGLNNMIHTPVVNNLLQEAQRENVSDVQNNGITSINPNKDILDKFYQNSNHQTSTLNNDYYLLLSCSSVYIPFESHVGGNYFQKALQVLAGSNYSDILSFYQEGSQYVKPLYIRDVGLLSSSPAKRVTLEDFIDSVNSGASFQLFLPKGNLQANPSGTGYEYYTNLKNSIDSQQKVSGNTSSTPSSSSSTSKSNSKTDTKSSTTQSSDDSNSAQIQTNTSSITDLNKLTPSVFNFGKVSSSGQSNNTVTATNIVKEYGSVINNNLESSPLYMNAFGDIITANGLVIVPGCANSTLLSANAPQYIYSTAFLESYPSLSENDLYFNVTNDRASGKYAISTIGATLQSGQQWNSISGDKYSQNSGGTFYGEQINNDTTLSFSSNLSLHHPYQTNLSTSLNSTASLVNFRTYQFKGGFLNIRGGINNFFSNASSPQNSADGAPANQYYFLTKQLLNSASKGMLAALYTTPPSQLTNQQIALLASNYYWYLTSNANGGETGKINNMMNNAFLAQTLVPCILNGTTSPLAYANYSIKSYAQTHATGVLHAYNTICTGLTVFIDKITNIQGALGMMSSYQDLILGTILRYVKDYFAVCSIILVLCLAFKFGKSRMDMLSLLIVGAMSFVILYGFIYVLPVTIPNTFNILNQYTSKEVAYKSLMINADNYKDLSKSVANLKQNPNSELTSSITLYTLNRKQIKMYAESAGMPVNELTDGTRHYISYSSGMFIQGNQVKENLDVMFINNPIIGRYVTQGNQINYKLFNLKMSNSSMDYYCPYYLIQQNFVNNLNQFAAIYRLTRATIDFDGVYKDSFLIEDFMKSPAFLTPGDYSSVSGTTSPETINKLEKVFKSNGDFLGLENLFVTNNVSEQNGIKSSLWYRTMKSQGITPTSKVMQQIVTDVNIRTKEFMIKNMKEFSAMPDANVIRIVSLYATCQFDKDISSYNHPVYPQNLNYQDITVGNALFASVANMQGVYLHPNYTVGQYIGNQYSIVGLGLYTIACINEAIIVFIMRVCVPLLFVLACVMLIYRMWLSKELSNLGTGVFKACGVIVLCLSLNTLMYNFVYSFNGNYLCIFILVICTEMLMETLSRLILLIAKNPSDFGNGQYDKLMPKLLKVARLDVLMSKLNVMTTTMRQGGRGAYKRYNGLPKNYSKYSRYNDLDDMYLGNRSEVFRGRRFKRNNIINKYRRRE